MEIHCHKPKTCVVGIQPLYNMYVNISQYCINYHTKQKESLWMWSNGQTIL